MLGLDAQVVFLDIACFFKGDRIEYVEEIPDEFTAVSNIEELVNKSLLIVKHGCLDMYDLIQDMGRDIVKQEAPQNLIRWQVHRNIRFSIKDVEYCCIDQCQVPLFTLTLFI